MKTDDIRHIIEEHISVAQLLQQQIGVIETLAQVCTRSILGGGKILLAGNGGSAADAQHLAAELTGRFERERRPLAAIALTTDTSALTAIGNDYGFDHIFSRQIDALIRPNDVFIAISTSGNSPNLVKAVARAHAHEAITIGFLGNTGGVLRAAVHYPIVVDSTVTARIQEMHILIGHILCGYIEQNV